MTKIAKRILLIGGNRYKESAPCTTFVKLCKQYGIQVKIISDKTRSQYLDQDDVSLEDFAANEKIEFQLINHISEAKLEKHANDNDLIIMSMNNHSIFSRSIVNMFDQRIFNYHNATLPLYRGAGAHSWRLMAGSLATNLTIHRIAEKVDTGEIICELNVKFDPEINNLEDTYKKIREHEEDLFIKFLSQKINIKEQSEHDSYYWPMLNTAKNGFIDWYFNAKEIKSFCAAFDKPYEGAKTFLGKSTVYFSNVELANDDFKFHPYQRGLIYRINNNGTFVATIEGGILVKSIVIEGDDTLRVGKRFITPQSIIESSLITV